MLVPAPGKLLAKIPGVTKGINALDKIAKHELNALRAATKTAKTEIVVLNGVKVSKPIAEQIETLQKGAGRILSSEETLNTARNLEGQLAHKAPVTSAFAKGIKNELANMDDALIKPLGKGSTGRTQPMNLTEQFAMKEVRTNPLDNAKNLSGSVDMTDPRWPQEAGWVKMQKTIDVSDRYGNRQKVNIHYVYNTKLNVFDDFKFK